MSTLNTHFLSTLNTHFYQLLTHTFVNSSPYTNRATKAVCFIDCKRKIAPYSIRKTSPKFLLCFSQCLIKCFGSFCLSKCWWFYYMYGVYLFVPNTTSNHPKLLTYPTSPISLLISTSTWPNFPQSQLLEKKTSPLSPLSPT